jgi:hypothetical protein
VIDWNDFQRLDVEAAADDDDQLSLLGKTT